MKGELAAWDRLLAPFLLGWAIIIVSGLLFGARVGVAALFVHIFVMTALPFRKLKWFDPRPRH